MKIVVATNNPHKISEYRSLLPKACFEVLSLKDIGVEIEIEETGKTYEENAMIKAMCVAKLTNVLVIADDSGLEIETLNDFPGLNSSRFAAGYANQKEANQALLEKLDKQINRNAKFVCVIALANHENQLSLFHGECLGKILHKAQGERGFGYDPIFYSYEAKNCFAALTNEQKNRYSHRAKAVAKLIEFFEAKQLI